MIGQIQTDKDGKAVSPVSDYQPPAEVAVLTARVKQDYDVGYNNQHRPFKEFNNYSLIERMNKDQLAFGSYVYPTSIDPDEEWRWNGTRPLTRQKLISIAAHATASLIYPNIFAQNDNDEEDKDAAYVMRMLMEFNIDNSDYEMNFLYGVVSALVNPCVYMDVEWTKSTQKIREKMENGQVNITEVIDEVMSGLQNAITPVEEVLIANPYQFYHQRQRFKMRQKYMDYVDLESVYDKHPNWKYVKQGIHATFNPVDGMFYDVQDDNMPTFCHKVKASYRKDDFEVCYINGIYFGDPDVENNPIAHRDNMNRPKYTEAKSGYAPIDTNKRFYYYRSAAADLSHDQGLVDEMWQIALDGSKIAALNPVGVSGDEEVDGSIMVPAGVTHFAKDTQVTNLGNGINPESAFAAVDQLEKSMSGSTQDDIRDGQAPAGDPTAFEIARIEENARIKLGLFGKMIRALVKDAGELILDDIIRYQTVGEMSEILDEDTNMKFSTYLVRNQNMDGKKITAKIKFDDSLADMQLDEDAKKAKSYEIMEEEGGYKSDQRLYFVNPPKFARLKYLIRMDADSEQPRSKSFQNALKLNAYDRMIESPYLEGEAITRDFLVEPLAPGQFDKYKKKMPANMPLQLPNTSAKSSAKGNPQPVDPAALELAAG